MRKEAGEMEQRGAAQVRGALGPPLTCPPPNRLRRASIWSFSSFWKRGLTWKRGKRGFSPAGLWLTPPHPTHPLSKESSQPPTVPTRCPGGKVQVKMWLRTKHSGGMQSCPWMARLMLGM